MTTTNIQQERKLAEITDIEDLEDEYVQFTFKINEFPVKINISKIKHKMLFLELVHNYEEGYKYDINKVLDAVWSIGDKDE